MTKKKKIICGGCKTEVNDSQKFCHECGAGLAPIKDAEKAQDPEVKASHKNAKFKDGDPVAVRTHASEEVKQGTVVGVVMNGTEPKTGKDGVIYKVVFSATDKDPQEYGEKRLTLGEAGV